MQARSWLSAYPNDEHQISYDWIENYTRTWFTPQMMEFGKEQISNGLGNPNVVSLIAETDGQVVGFLLGLRKHPDHGDADLIARYCEPGLFGTGIGHALITEYFTLIDDANVRLDVAVYNERAIQFYQRHGFAIVPDSERLYRINKSCETLIAGVNAIPTVDMYRNGIKRSWKGNGIMVEIRKEGYSKL